MKFNTPPHFAAILEVHGCIVVTILLLFHQTLLIFSIPLVATGEDSTPLTLVIFLSLDQLLFFSLGYNLLSLLSFLSFIRLLLLLPILSHQPVVSTHSYDSLLSPFPSYSSMFYSFPLSSFFSWSMCASPTYINSIVTVCIPHS